MEGADTKMARAKPARRLPIGRRIFDQARFLEVTRQFDQRDLRFEPGQRRSHTVMNTLAEAKMLIIGTLRIKTNRYVKAQGNSDPRSQDRIDRRSLMKRYFSH